MLQPKELHAIQKGKEFSVAEVKAGLKFYDSKALRQPRLKLEYFFSG